LTNTQNFTVIRGKVKYLVSWFVCLSLFLKVHKPRNNFMRHLARTMFLIYWDIMSTYFQLPWFYFPMGYKQLWNSQNPEEILPISEKEVEYNSKIQPLGLSRCFFPPQNITRPWTWKDLSGSKYCFFVKRENSVFYLPLYFPSSPD
jgi:hypothetical protein